MPTTLPDRSTKKWGQDNSSDLFGILSRTKNMDFDLAGYAKLAKRTRSIFTEDGDANFRRVTAIEVYDSTGEYFITTADHLFKLTIAEAMTVADQSGGSNVPSMDGDGYSDLVNWQGYLYCTGDASGNLRRYNGSWSTDQYDLASGGPMAVFQSKNYLAIGQSNTVLLLNTSHSLVVTLTLPSEFHVTSVAYSNGYLYVGTRHKNNGEAMLFQWDGNTAVANNAWGVGAQRINSVKRYKQGVALFTSSGRLLYFNGGGFQELGALPIYYTDYDFDRPGSANLGRVVHRGMVVEDDVIFVHISPRLLISTVDVNASQFFDWLMGGVWCYDPKVGFYHRYSNSTSLRSRSNAVATTDVNTTTEVITIGGVTVPVTGTPVIYDAAGGTAIGGLVDGVKYYVIKVSGTTMKLASTLALATAGTAINLTGTGNNSQVFTFLPNRDFGGITPIGGDSIFTDSSSAVALFRNTSSAAVRGSTARRIIFGGQLGTNTVTEKYTLCVAAENQENRGYIVTAKIPASALQDTFQNFSIKYKGVKTAEDVIIPKYRVVERLNPEKLNALKRSTPRTGTWGVIGSTTSMLQVTDDLTTMQIGDEVEICNGAGAGLIGHITTFNGLSGTYEVTIDEVPQNVSVNDTCYFYIENWEKLETITTADNEQFTIADAAADTYTGDGGLKTFSLSKQGKWLEIKIEVRGEDVMLEEIYINNIPLRQLM